MQSTHQPRGHKASPHVTSSAITTQTTATPAVNRRPAAAATRRAESDSENTTVATIGWRPSETTSMTGASEIERVQAEDRAQEAVSDGFAGSQRMESNQLEDRIGRDQRQEQPPLSARRDHPIFLAQRLVCAINSSNSASMSDMPVAVANSRIQRRALAVSASG